MASNGLITNEETIEKNPDLVRRMTAAFLKGLADTMANPDEAYTISKKYIPDLAKANETTQKEILARTIELWKTPHLGLSDPQGLAEHAGHAAQDGLVETAAGREQGLYQ